MSHETNLNVVEELHWYTQVIDTMDVGIFVLDLEFKVVAWNRFMQSYSGISSAKILHKPLFSVCKDLPEAWMEAKFNATISLGTQGFSSWEDRAYIFEFNNFSPASRGLEQMHQNMVITPLSSLSGQVSHLCVMISDVSDTAQSKMLLHESNRKLEHKSRIDGLTGLLNRASWEESLIEEYNRLKIDDDRVSTLIMFDIDFFKRVNDNYGHSIGDEVIRHTAQLAQKTSRGSDFVGRYGGEEFAVLLPNTCHEQALYFAERLRKRIEESQIASPQGVINYTISLGVCEFNRSAIDSATGWIEAADTALYKSKENGRNMTTVHSVPA
ncbi:diguanylate cyclase [Vibrio sp. YMD68]|uniref:sensor domain-containing diguanylate cyclase n=1 Tax=Vibrio sp. YMD68 TaxID=3042300 RepID=UPI00249A37F2|nr:diguanylate cyclase [Vibrio sp. YMD68]WGW00536.1 diguanylate cyclase [Vibrio sp. YMD68]